MSGARLPWLADFLKREARLRGDPTIPEKYADWRPRITHDPITGFVTEEAAPLSRTQPPGLSYRNMRGSDFEGAWLYADAARRAVESMRQFHPVLIQTWRVSVLEMITMQEELRVLQLFEAPLHMLEKPNG